MTDATLEACFLQYLARRIRAEVVWFERGRQSEGESFAKVVKLMQNAWELLPSEGALRAWLTTEVELPDRWLRRVALSRQARGASGSSTTFAQYLVVLG